MLLGKCVNAVKKVESIRIGGFNDCFRMVTKKARTTPMLILAHPLSTKVLPTNRKTGQPCKKISQLNKRFPNRILRDYPFDINEKVVLMKKRHKKGLSYQPCII